jgi:copper(I)-binding protein
LAVGALALAACGDDDSDSGSQGTEPAADTSVDTTVDTTIPTTAGDEISFAGEWARNSPAAATMGAAYLTITSPVDDALVGAKVDASIAGTAEIHEMVMDHNSMGGMGTETTMHMGGMGTETTMPMGGQMVMQEVDRIELPAGQAVELKPGSYHIMLIDLVAPLELGGTVQITLIFENAGEITIEFPVLEEAP